MSLGRYRCAVLLAAVAFGVHPIACADDANPDVQYRNAQLMIQKAATLLKQVGELETRIGKTDDADERVRLQKEVAGIRKSAAEEQAEARKIMESLAPRDRKGYGPAHLWLVDLLYRFEQGPDGKSVPPTPRVILECERHLLYALEWPDETVRVGAHFALARLYRDTGRVDDAKKHLTEVAARHPEYRLILAQWAKAQGENDVVVPHAKAAENAFRARVTVKQDDHDARFGVVECLILQEKFDEAEKLINTGATLATAPEVLQAYSRKTVSLLIAWFDAKEKDPKSPVSDRFELLERALKLDFENPEIYNRILKLCRDKSPEGEKVREKLRSMVVEGRESHLLHLFLGIDAWEQKKQDEARYHWEKALKLSPNASIVANNLAWLLAFSEPMDLSRALELANTAVEKTPDAAQFRGTRGHILLKLGRHKEALADLEKAIKVYPDDPQLFHALADACEKLGFTIQAQEYRKRARELESKKKPATGPAKP